MTRKFVLTGGPSTGKTTLVQALKQEGHQVMEEVARQIMESEKINYMSLSRMERMNFQIKVFIKQLELEGRLSKQKAAFLDRGIPDCIAYCRLGGFDPPRELVEASKRNRYDKVFLLQMLPDYETDSIRKEDAETARKIHNHIRDVYKELGYEVIEIPPVSVRERIHFIKKHI